MCTIFMNEETSSIWNKSLQISSRIPTPIQQKSRITISNEETFQKELVNTLNDFFRKDFSSGFESINELSLDCTFMDSKQKHPLQPNELVENDGDESPNLDIDNRLKQLVVASHEPGFAGLEPEESREASFDNNNNNEQAMSLWSATAQNFGKSPSGTAPCKEHNMVNLVIPKSKVKEASNIVIDPSKITEVDVLLERGGKGNRHKGSKYYRRLINEHRERYQALPDTNKIEKMAISLSVVTKLKETGARFIHKKNGQYSIMNDRQARNKISQALREKNVRVMTDLNEESSLSFRANKEPSVSSL